MHKGHLDQELQGIRSTTLQEPRPTLQQTAKNQEKYNYLKTTPTSYSHVITRLISNKETLISTLPVMRKQGKCTLTPPVGFLSPPPRVTSLSSADTIMIQIMCLQNPWRTEKVQPNQGYHKNHQRAEGGSTATYFPHPRQWSINRPHFLPQKRWKHHRSVGARQMPSQERSRKSN